MAKANPQKAEDLEQQITNLQSVIEILQQRLKDLKTQKDLLG